MVPLLILGIAFILILVSVYFLFIKEDVQKRIEKLKIFYNQGNLDIALNQFKELAAKYKDITEVHWYLALIYKAKGRNEFAEEETKKIIALKKYTEEIDEIKVRKLLADIYYHENKLDDSLKEYILVNQKEPDDIEVLFELGHINIKRESYRDAVVCFEKYTKNNPGNDIAFYYLGFAYYKMGSIELAEQNFVKSISLNNALPESHYYLGDIFFKNQDYDKALTEFESALASKELKIDAEISIGRCFYTKNFFKQAIPHLKNGLTKTIEDNDEKCEILFILADCLVKIGEIEDALSYYEKIIPLDPKYKDVAKKIDYYKDISGSDLLGSLLKADDTSFIEIGKEIVGNMHLNINEYDLSKNGILDIIAYDHSAKISESCLVEIIRFESSIGELTLREMNSKMQDMQINRGICIASGIFTPEAINYTSSRSIQLYDKTELIKILKKK